MRIVICDTGPILHLREIDALWLLERAGEVTAPPAVDRELAARLPDWARERPGWLRVPELSSAVSRQADDLRAMGDLGPGEAEAIALARSLEADWLLTDDAGARLVASLLGLEVHGSLGVVLWGAAAGHLHRAQARDLVDRLAVSSLWIARTIVDEARAVVDRLTE